MKKLKLLIPALGTVAALSAVVPAVSCGTPKDENKKTYTISLDESCKDYFTLSVTKIQEGHDLYLNIVPKEGYGINANAETFLKITIGTTELDAEKFEIDEERANAELLPIVIKAEDINGNISIAVKQQILSHATFQNSGRIPSDSIAVSWGDSEMPYLEESVADQEQEVTFYISDPRYSSGYALYVNYWNLSIVDSDGTSHNLTYVAEPTAPLEADEYTIDLNEGYYTPGKTLIFGAGTFSSTITSTLEVEVFGENYYEQNIYITDDTIPSTDLGYDDVLKVASQTQTTRYLRNNIIEIYVDMPLFEEGWAFNSSNPSDYTVRLWNVGGYADPIIHPISVELTGSNRYADLTFSSNDIWTIQTYALYNVEIFPSIAKNK